MTHIDNTIARIPDMAAKERASWLRKAKNALTKKSDNADALRLLDALTAFETDQVKPMSLDVTGLLAWEKYQQGNETPFRGFHGDRVVGRIIKRATHTGTRKNVYSVEILGQVLTGAWQNIRDAREAGEIAYVTQLKETPT